MKLRYVSEDFFPQLGYEASAPNRTALINQTAFQPEELKSKVNSLSAGDNIVCKQ